MLFAGHTEDACAQVLLEEFAVGTANQPNVSRWATGATKQPRCRDALIAYTRAYGPPPPRVPTESPPTAEASSGAQDDDDQASNVSDFDSLAGMASEQPLLGPEQLDLVRSMNHRIKFGPPLTGADLSAYKLHLQVLRMHPKD